MKKLKKCIKSMVKPKLVRSLKFSPAYNKRSNDPKKNYGCHCLTMIFMVKGKKGAVNFTLYTNWHLPEIMQEIEDHQLNPSFQQKFVHLLCKPMPADLGYHAYKPQYEDQRILMKSCDFLDGKPCYYDGSTMNAEPVFKILVAKGDEAVYQYLEEYYMDIFYRRNQ